MKEFVFVDMQEADLPAVLSIYNHYIETTTATFDPAPVSMEVFNSRVLLNHALYKAYVILHGEEIAGFCFLSRYSSHESYDRTADVGLYLKPGYTRKGLGTKAVEYLERVAFSKGLKVLVASISGENTASINLFQKLGWEKCGHFKEIGEKWNRAIDVVYFQKFLELCRE